jgi:methylmalonyl-CoA mutase N-terminal domain/subunit
MQDEIARSAYEYQRNIESGEKIIVGVNKFQVKKTNTIPGFKIDDSIRTIQSDKLKQLRAKRDQQKVTTLLQAIETTARSTENLMPIVVEAVENLCTLGEISDALRLVYGEYK